MREIVKQMTDASDARSYLDAVMSLHRALVAAARIPVLDGMHQTVVALLRATLSRRSSSTVTSRCCSTASWCTRGS